MTEVSITSARDTLAEVLNRAAYGKERLVLTRRGKRLVAVIPLEDLELLEDMEDQWDVQQAQALLEREQGEPRIAWEQVKEQAGLTPRASGRPRGGGRAVRSAPRAAHPRSGR